MPACAGGPAGRRGIAPTTNKGRKIEAVLSDKNLLSFLESAKMSLVGNVFFRSLEGAFMARPVNLGDKYTHRVTLRLNEEQYDFLIKVSNILGISPSDYLRMVVNTGMVTTKNGINELSNGDMMKGMVGTDENVKTNSDDIL